MGFRPWGRTLKKKIFQNRMTFSVQPDSFRQIPVLYSYTYTLWYKCSVHLIFSEKKIQIHIETETTSFKQTKQTSTRNRKVGRPKFGPWERSLHLSPILASVAGIHLEGFPNWLCLPWRISWDWYVYLPILNIRPSPIHKDAKSIIQLITWKPCSLIRGCKILKKYDVVSLEHFLR